MTPLASRSSAFSIPVFVATSVLAVACTLPSDSIGDLADSSTTTGASAGPDSGCDSMPAEVTDDGPLDDEGTSVASEPSTGGSSDSNASEPTSGGQACDGELPPSTGDTCSVHDQDCPACYRCTFAKIDGVWATNEEQAVCVLAPEEGRAPGEPCTIDAATGNDDCEPGSFCYPPPIDDYEPRCVAFCASNIDFTCDVPETYCVGSSGAGSFGCFQACDPLLQDCNASEICTLTYPGADGFACYPSGIEPSELVGVMGECSNNFECQPGLLCVGAERLGPACTGLGCCTPLCDATDPSAQADCQAVDAALSCVSGCEFGSPPDYPDLGGCIVDEPVPGLCEPPGIDDTYPWCSWLNADACGDPGSFGAGNECFDYCHCYVPCDDVSECDVAPTGNATPACRLGEVGESNSCVLECDNGETCPDGMVCSDMFSPSLCLWPTPAEGC